LGSGIFIGGDDARPQRAERGERLAAAPLAAAAVPLPVAGAHVVGAGVAEHVLEGVGPADVVTGLPDHDGQFALVVDLVAPQLPRQHDRIARVLHGARVLEEQHGMGWRGGVALGGVLLVVEADAEDVAGLEWCEQLVDLRHGAGVAERTEQVTLEKRHAAVGVEASQMGGAGGFEANDFHGRALPAEKVWRAASVPADQMNRSR
jgi:hypothetical protein